MMDLCRPCAVEIEKTQGVKLRTVKQGVNMKVTCMVCGRRRYGATYELQKPFISKAKA